MPDTFEMAFAGNRRELSQKLDLSHGLLEMLLDRNIINNIHYQVIKVFSTRVTFYNLVFIEWLIIRLTTVLLILYPTL